MEHDLTAGESAPNALLEYCVAVPWLQVCEQGKLHQGQRLGRTTPEVSGRVWGRQRKASPSQRPTQVLSRSVERGITRAMAPFRRHQARSTAPASIDGPPLFETAPGAVAPADRPQMIPAPLTASAWAALAAGLVLLVAVLVFILQNLKDVRVSFFTVHWRIPLGLDLLFAALLGGFIVFAAGSIRILRLRRVARRHGRRGGGKVPSS
jgi:uncharacterized integral membrane protein